MARTTPAAVKAITGSTLDDSVIEIFIDSASCIIDQIEACTIGKGISSDCLINAETFLAAHLLTRSSIGQSSGALKRETFENYTQEWAQNTGTGTGVLSSGYGEDANALTGGCLQEVDKRTPTLFFTGGAGC